MQHHLPQGPDRGWLMWLWRQKSPETSRPRRADGGVLVWVQRPEKQQNWWCKFQSESGFQGGRGPVSQLESRQREWILPHLASCSVQAFSGLDKATTLGKALSFPQSTDSNTNLIQKQACRHLGIRFNQISGHPVARSEWRIKWTNERTTTTLEVTWQGSGLMRSWTHLISWTLIWYGRTLNLKAGRNPLSHLVHFCHFIDEEINPPEAVIDLLKFTWLLKARQMTF